MKWVYSLFLCLIAASLFPVMAEVIYVSGEVSGTWEADTVIVTDNVVVTSGETLTIEPGVEVLFSPTTKLTVESGASLTAIGIPSDSIRFDELTPEMGWGGLKLLSGANMVQLFFCHVTNAISPEDGGGIYAYEAALTVKDCLIDNCTAGHEGGGMFLPFAGGEVVGNTVMNNSAYIGGGIWCTGSGLLISGNIVRGNSCDTNGGGIHCGTSILTFNLVDGNVAGEAGGGLYCGNIVEPYIYWNTIINNSVRAGNGGGVCLEGSHPPMSHNYIGGNTASQNGGGISIEYGGCPLEFEYNIIRDNYAGNNGGGMYWGTGTGWFYVEQFYCEISGNTAGNLGGGVYRNAGYPFIKCTIAGNSAADGGGFYRLPYPTSYEVENCVVWGNSPNQFSENILTPVTYSCVEGGYEGEGNFDQYPDFIDTLNNNFNLAWGSPCIDAGIPHPDHNDPDGTRADIGALFYDQSGPIRLLLTPYDVPILLPQEGGDLDFVISATNSDTNPVTMTIWFEIFELTKEISYGTVFGPVTVSINPGATISRLRTQSISSWVPKGYYRFDAYAATASDTSSDVFSFWKLESDLSVTSGSWLNTGEPFETSNDVMSQAEGFKLVNAYPNPFNPTTAISYQLSAFGQVNLSIYDVSGRKVATLVDGYRDAGVHEVTFDGTGLASGVYLYALQSDKFNSTGKFVLVK